VTLKKSVRWDIWCDDGRYCDGQQGQAMLVLTKTEAIETARALGWKVKTNHTAQCPDCANKRRN
jgi:hypothetical protein